MDDNQPGQNSGQSLLLDGARWPEGAPLSPIEIKVAQQHAVLAINRFIALQALPQAYRPLFPGLIIPMAASLLREQRRQDTPLLVAISGSQGSGKSTLALALQIVLTNSFAARSCVLSLDDFYLSRPRREKLAREVHPLLQTRGVPGTHDISLLQNTLDGLLDQRGGPVSIPAFDKGADNPLPQQQWPVLDAGPEVIILEGWCLGAQPQPEADLRSAVNELEAEEDSQLHWRSFVNQQIEIAYQPLMERFSTLIYLMPPDWDAVYNWRARQEAKLIKRQGDAYRGNLETPERLKRFISHYQRLTEAMMAQLPATADVVLRLNRAQQFSRLGFGED